VIPLLSWSIRCKAKQRGIDYSFLFMQPNGAQLTQITQLDEAEKLKPIIDQIHDFDQAQEALQYVNTGRSKGKVILKIKS
jgi:NADPH:quinone reductase-like Zn-dependent oxidoreductase